MLNSEYMEYRWKWENYPKIYHVDRVPVHLDVELTTRCNYKCKMCVHSFSPPEPRDMPVIMAKTIIKEFAEKGGSSIKFVYLGEPLLYKNLDKVIAYAKKKGIIDTMIATNGSLLTPGKSKKLIISGLDFIIFSVDSSDPETYTKIRIGGDLDKVKQNIIALHSLKQLFGAENPRIQIQAIPMKENLEEIQSGRYKTFWEPYADVIRISPYCEDYENTEIIGKTPNFFCPSVFRRMTVRANGNIAVCCGYPDWRKTLGNINWMSLESAWLSRRFIEIRTLMKARKSHLIDICQTCSLRTHGG